MDIYWYGQACFKLKGKNASVVIDPFDPDFTGIKLPKDLSGDVVLSTHEHKDHSNVEVVTNPAGGKQSLPTGKPMIFKQAGEYEVSGVVITGISSFHDRSNGSQRGVNIIFHIMFDGLNLVHLGDLGQEKLTEEQIAQIGQTDILFVPVGSIFTIDAKTASEIVSQLEPKIIIPMHYKTPGLKFELDTVDNFLKEMGAENVAAIQKLSISSEKLPSEPQVVVLSKA